MVTVAVYEGERPLVKDNHLLGKFDLTDIPPMQKGKPEVEVTFEIDDDGILSVEAVEKSAGSRNQIVITNDKGRLSKEEIEKMLQDAEDFAEDDKVAKERIDSKSSLESYIYSVKN